MSPKAPPQKGVFLVSSEVFDVFKNRAEQDSTKTDIHFIVPVGARRIPDRTKYLRSKIHRVILKHIDGTQVNTVIKTNSHREINRLKLKSNTD